MLVEFWDFCRPNSMRTLPYVKAWHERYAEHGVARDRRALPRVRSFARGAGGPGGGARGWGSSYPVLIDSELAVWQEYENEGWPARYLFDGHARLFEYHYGEGAYAETELAIQELLGVEREPLAPLRPEDAPGALLAPQTEDQPGAYTGPYEAGGVWAVLDGAGVVRVNGRRASTGDPPGRLPADRARSPHGGRAGAGAWLRRRVLRDVLHAGRGLGAGSVWASLRRRRHRCRAAATWDRALP